ncbi:MAG: ATP/GTP-binding protein [Archaeoglobaceae archaeon]|nr:ATP/GTP-binding protein [Archaeoglobaceae archaeon]MCX8152259.1 ATP/GTP-binding protein [Archaeoglobaceae archaeon]MDW8013937.1 ATP/GTP-binding protein [Archaeoglobaceae archaeon]
MQLFVTGPAGSGKSTFVKEFSSFLSEKGYSVACINLDPATEPIFKASKDVRDFVKAEEIMKKFSLGINGALMKSMQLIENFAEKLKVDADFVLYDTPGQMELFIYSESGRNVVRILSDRFTVSLFLIDSSQAIEPENFIAAVMQNVIVSLRLSIPSLTVFTKSDLVKLNVKEIRKRIRESEGVLAELLEKVEFFVEYTTIPYRILTVSDKWDGFEDVLGALKELFCACGDIS